jgi:predicted dehydrogenase
MVMDKIAVLGFGSSGRRFASLVSQRLPEAELLVYSSQRLTGEPFYSTSNLSEVRKFEPSIAVICGVASDRLDMVKALPREMRGVLIEKPLAMNYEDGIQVTDELAQRGGITHVGYNLRFSASLREFKRKVDSLRFGRVLSVRAETGQHLPDWRNGRDYRTTASASGQSGGGVLRELSHEIDYLQWIFGEVEWVSAWCGKQSDFEIDVEDTAHLTLGFSPEAALPMLVGQLNLDFTRHDRTRSITAVCAEGTLRWDGITLRVEEWPQGGAGWEVSYAEEASAPTTYERQWDSFYLAVTKGATPEVTVGDGLAVLSVIDSAWASHDSEGIRVSPSQAGFSS